MELPKEIQIGGQTLTTQICDELGGKLGKCCCYNGYVKIATNVDGSKQSESSMFNTYIHECVHAILDTMGRDDLSQDETFVSSFAGFATEAIVCVLKQKLKQQPQWKPTDEQIDALDKVYKTHGADCECRHIILGLLNDLKKL